MYIMNANVDKHWCIYIKLIINVYQFSMKLERLTLEKKASFGWL